MYRQKPTYFKLSMHIIGCSKKLTTRREFTSELHSNTTTRDETRKPPIMTIRESCCTKSSWNIKRMKTEIGLNNERWSFLSAVLLLCSQVLVAQQPAKNSEAAKFGLLGAVHTVLTESLDYRDSTQGTPTGSTLAIYDAKGYLLEVYRYYPDGAVHLHTTYTRKGWQIFKTETTSAIASESRTIVQTFNSDGDVVLAETVDGSGLISPTKNEFPSRNGGPTVSAKPWKRASGTS